MKRRIRFYKTLFLALIGGLAAAIVGFLQPARTAHARDGGTGPALAPDCARLPHTVPVRWDTDGDLMRDAEETALGLDPVDPDQNSNETLDGIEVAKTFHQIIEDLPEGAPNQIGESRIVKRSFCMLGLETCQVCGQAVNMGFVRISNPMSGASIDIPFIALHFMENGSFQYGGSIHTGRVDVARFGAVLHDAHRLPVRPDADGDLLTDAEEAAAGTDPLDPDEDDNFSPDGADLALALKHRIDRLPGRPLPEAVYRIEHKARGRENCEICGLAINMGFVEIVDPVRGIVIEIPLVGLHGMDHGSLTFAGTHHDGRVDLAALRRLLCDE